MNPSIKEVLESKGITVAEEHLPVLQARWEAVELLKKETNDASLADFDIALRNIPGGDHYGL
ncbi:hypothetical protein EPH95_03630 [Salicibibacter halophilus]|uniref:Uncharacterized protein n=1 Tax=Salicibibacter halophilus TaxID=2502791 RepID=A0A514LGI2_9BACI|nr:hypothetical protein [Salicibibacter halophilus]QDI90381.1 hypothetical protein EPH95_03630 [Salicibibacter halophilus]